MDDEDVYAAVTKGKLKLKNDSDISKKKKKKISIEKVHKVLAEHQNIASDSGDPGSQVESNGKSVRQLTKAELSFKQMQEKMQKKRVLDKASLTHKQRVEKFNEHLDSLTEHFDIPKVSWTK